MVKIKTVQFSKLQLDFKALFRRNLRTVTNCDRI